MARRFSPALREAVPGTLFLLGIVLVVLALVFPVFQISRTRHGPVFAEQYFQGWAGADAELMAGAMVGERERIFDMQKRLDLAWAQGTRLDHWEWVTTHEDERGVFAVYLIILRVAERPTSQSRILLLDRETGKVKAVY